MPGTMLSYMFNILTKKNNFISPVITIFHRKLHSRVYKNLNHAILIDKERDAKTLLREEISKCSSSEQWEELSKKLVGREIRLFGCHVNELNVNTFIMRQCNDLKLFNAGQLFYQHLLSKNTSLGDSILSQYLNLCCLDRNFAMTNEQLLIRIYKKVTSASIIEPLIAERCISAICLFENHWEDSFLLLEQVRFVTEPTPGSYNAIIEACFKFGNIEKGWDIFRHLASTSPTKPKPESIMAYLNYCKGLKNKNEAFNCLERLFKFLEEFHFNVPNIEVVEELEKLLFSISGEKYKWNLKETFIPKSGVCANCRRSLEPVQLTTEEFADLCKSFASKAIIGNNVFLKSTPDEMKRFKHFVENAQPYDMVIDGLNVAYATGNKDPATLSRVVRTVVNHFIRRKDKVVVLGRKHMLKWPDMDFVMNNCKVFLATNLSHDDPLLLYAALRGGEKTCFISRDFMRSHLFALGDPRMKLLFRKWLISHQFRLGFFDKTGRPNIIQPLPYRPTAQKLPLTTGEVCWHIPYDLDYQMLPPDKRDPPPRWLCLRGMPRS